MENQIWKDIENYEGLYQISNTGLVKSLSNDKQRKERILVSVVVSKNSKGEGYLEVNLCKNRVVKHFKIHILVAKYFISNSNNYKIVNHKDSNKLNNNDWNLEWTTQRDNVYHYHNNKNGLPVCIRLYRNGKYLVRVSFNKKENHLGYFRTVEEAIIARNNFLNKTI